MRVSTRDWRLATAILGFVVVGCAPIPPKPVSDNGIFVEAPKVYDDRTLQQQLLTLSNRLSHLSSAASTLTPDKKGVPKGNTGAYKIAQTNLQLVAEIRYLNAPIPFSYSADGTSIDITQLPASLVATAGRVPLEVRLSDGTKQVFAVTVNP